MKKILIVMMLAGCLFAANSNQTITFQGKLLDNAGVVVRTPTNMTYTFYTASVGGSAIPNASWTKTNVPVNNGIYVVELDVTNVTLPNDVWVQVTVGGQDLSPRIHLTSSVFSRRSALADTAVHASSADSSTTANIAQSLVAMGATSGQVLKFNGSQWAPGTDASTAYAAGSGLTLNGTVFSNTAPDRTVVMSQGSGISVSGTYPNFTIANTAPDQTVAMSSGTGISVSGTYPNFTIGNSSPNATHTGDVVGSVSLTIVTGSVTSAKIASGVSITGTITTANTALALSMTSGTGILQIVPTSNPAANSFDFLY